MGGRMSNRKAPTREPVPDPQADDSAYLTQWAANLAASVTPDELRATIKSYEAIARNQKLPDEDRRLARYRAKALKEQL